jgi:hypothetical protein
LHALLWLLLWLLPWLLLWLVLCCSCTRCTLGGPWCMPHHCHTVVHIFCLAQWCWADGRRGQAGSWLWAAWRR